MSVPKHIVLKPFTHSLETYTLQYVKEKIEKCFIEKYFLCMELDPHLHFHALVYIDTSTETLRARLKKEFNFFKVAIKMKDIQSEILSVAYMMKENNYTFSQLDLKFLNEAKQKSFNPKLDYSKWKKSLEDQYERHEITWRQFVSQYLHHHIHTYNRNISKYQLSTYFLKVKAKEDRDFFNELVNYFIDVN